MRRFLAAIVVGMVALAFVPPPADAAPRAVTGGALDWGVKASFRTYTDVFRMNEIVAIAFPTIPFTASYTAICVIAIVRVGWIELGWAPGATSTFCNSWFHWITSSGSLEAVCASTAP